MKRPLVVVVLFYGSGLLLGEFVPIGLSLLVPAALLTSASCFLFDRARFLLLPVLIVLAGWTNMSLRTAILSPHDLRLRNEPLPAIVTLRGKLGDEPEVRVFEKHSGLGQRTVARLEVTGMQEDGTQLAPAYGKVFVTTSCELPPNYYAGMLVEVTGVLSVPPGPAAPGLFDWRGYLRRQGIYFQLRASSAADWKPIVGQEVSAPLSVRFLGWAHVVLGKGLITEDLSLELLRSMTLGWKGPLPSSVYQPFVQSGTMHIFAISGLHIALISLILVAFLRSIRFSRAHCAWIVLPLIWFYTGATGWQPSAIRSTVMMSVVIGGWALNRPGDFLNSLAGAALLILIWDPQQLFGASFQLSFSVVFSIVLLMPLVEHWRERLLAPDPFLPHPLLPRWKLALEKPARMLLTLFGTSLAAWLGSLPLTAYYFHIVSPVTVLANMLVVPLSEAALACNLGALFGGIFGNWIAAPFNNSAWMAMLLMVKISQGAANLPGAWFAVPTPGAAVFVAYYGLLIGACTGVVFQRRFVPWTAATGFALVTVAAGQAWTNNDTEITVLPMDGGYSIYFNAPGHSRDCLVDSGSTNSFQYLLHPFLQAKGINRLPHFVLTHGDSAHAAAAQDVIAAFKPRNLWASNIRFRSPVYRRTMEFCTNRPGLLHQVSRKAFLGPWTMLHPDETTAFTYADDNAMVLKAAVAGKTVLVVSDLASQGQKHLLSHREELKADLVIAGVPSRGEPLEDGLLDAIGPKMIVIADSEFPAHNRLRSEVLERLSKRNVPVVVTSKTGVPTIKVTNGGIEVRAMDGTNVTARY